MSTISTHVLDTALGRPAAGIGVTLERVAVSLGDSGSGDDTSVIGVGATDADGRLRELVAPGVAIGQGVYQLRFAVDEYFARTGRETCFYPEVVVVFRVGPSEEHYHVPVLLSPFGYTTYRGS